MPPASSSPTGTTSQGSILLIEEYDALAAAITSALRKFAPRHRVHVARSLTEAGTLARKIQPALFVVDFDPAFPGLSAFLQKMQATHPDARVLLIAGKLPREVIGESRFASAIQFVEKPFDVPDFGAAVQALLGPWTQSETATRRGTLQSLGLSDLLLAQCAGGRTIALEIENDTGKSGEVYFRQGTLSHAETGKKSGADALREMLRWDEIEIREKEKHRSGLRTLEANWTEVLIETLREIKPRPLGVGPEIEPASPRAKTGNRIVVVDDTEMLLIFVEDVLMTSDPQFQITTAIDGLSGIEEIERVQPDLVLLDYSLPDINGDEVCRRLLQNESTAHIPVLMMSGHVPEMSKAAATLDNVVVTIAKPFLSDALIKLVQQTLREARPVKRKRPAGGGPSTPPSKPARATEKEKEHLVPAQSTSRDVEAVATPAAPEAVETGRLQVEETASAAPLSIATTPPAEIAKPPRQIVPEQPRESGHGVIAMPVLSDDSNEVVLGLFLDVVSVQLTSEFRMGSIRARPSSFDVSLHMASPAARMKLPANGFQLGEVGLDGSGRISTIRLIPTLTPFKAAETRSALQIGAVAVVPIDSAERVQLTPTAGAPMTLQLVVHLELAGVELSPEFQISQLVLKSRSRVVRVTMNAQGPGQEANGTACETLAVGLDHSAHITEMVLNPVR